MSSLHRANAWLVDQGSAAVSSERLVERLGRWAQSEGTLAEGLAGAIASLVRSGELRPGDRLPAERALAGAAAVSRGTVVSAYSALAEAGLVERQQGSGTRVAGSATRIAPGPGEGRTGALFSALPSSIDLLRGVPQMSELAVAIVREHRPLTEIALLSETDPVGLPVLRECIAQQFEAEGTPTTPEQILVTHGAQAALYLLAEELVRPGDVVLVECLTWPGLSDVLRRRGASVLGLPMGPDGLDLDALELAIVRMRPALVAVNPHHQNPTGTRMPPEARQRLAELSARYGVPVLEDRVPAHVAFDGVVPPSLAALRPDAPIVVAESVSKWAWSGLRVGWIRADPVLVRRMCGSRQVTDLFTSVPAQLLALDFLSHTRELRREVSERHAHLLGVLCELLAEHLPELRYQRPRGGFSLWARMPEGCSADELIRLAAMRGVSVAGSSSFATAASREEGIRLPFTAPEPVLREGIRRLGEAWNELRSPGASARRDV